MWDSKPATCYSQETYNSVLQRRWMPCECPPHRTDCPLKRRQGGGTRKQKKKKKKKKKISIRDVCQPHGKGLDKQWDSYRGWVSWISRTISHFVSFKNKNHRLQFESCLISSSDHGVIRIKLDLVESKVFSINEMHAESSFPCDYITSRNGYCKHVMTSTTKSKCV